MVFLKAPRRGTVKTRLGRNIGFDKALRIYRTLAETQVDRIPPSIAGQINYAPRGALPEMRAWLGNKLDYCVQAGGGLGDRLSHAFAAAFRCGHAPVMAIGADCPELDGDCLERAVGLLRQHDVVLGPAGDGGYYLIGLRRPAAELFRGIPWSTGEVLSATLARAEGMGWTHALLEQKDDVDTVADLRRWLERCPEALARRCA